MELLEVAQRITLTGTDIGTLIVGLLVLIGTALTAWSAFRSAKASEQTATVVATLQSSDTRFVARSERYARWQMYKRETYAKLLATIRAHRERPTVETRIAIDDAFSRAYLAAEQDFLPHLDQLFEHLSQDPRLEGYVERDLARRMRSDVFRKIRNSKPTLDAANPE
jgi:hypothetical protein